MSDTTIYDKGGYDPSKPNDNVATTLVGDVDKSDIREKRLTRTLITNRKFLKLKTPTADELQTQLVEVTKQLNTVISSLLTLDDDV